MLVSECLDSVYRAFGAETAIKMFKDAGFEAFDYSLFGKCIYSYKWS